jgi:hypothetical protein
MDELVNFKKIQINNYFSSQYDLSESNLNIYQIKKDLHMLIGEEPGVQLNYETENLIMEDGTESKKIQKLNSISIYFTYDINIGSTETIPRFEKVTYLI